MPTTRLSRLRLRCSSGNSSLPATCYNVTCLSACLTLSGRQLWKAITRSGQSSHLKTGEGKWANEKHLCPVFVCPLVPLQHYYHIHRFPAKSSLSLSLNDNHLRMFSICPLCLILSLFFQQCSPCFSLSSLHICTGLFLSLSLSSAFS